MKINTEPLHKFEFDQISNHAFTMALLTPDTYQYVHSPVMCKDYFQDIFWSEQTGGKGECYGLRWKPGIFPTAPRYNLGVHGGKEEMASKAVYLQAFLNHFDAGQGIDLTTVTATDDPFALIINFAHDWTTSGAMISAFTALVRLGGGFKGGCPKEYLKSLDKPLFDGNYKQIWEPEPKFITQEVSRMGSIRPRLLAILAGKKYTGQWSAAGGSMNSAHTYGIQNTPNFPKISQI